MSVKFDFYSFLRKSSEDYIKKPFDLQEFRLKIRKITNQHEIEKIENLFFNMRKRVLYENEIEINLTKSERNLLYLLINNRGEKITHNQIEDINYNQLSFDERLYDLLTFSKKSKNQILHSTNPFIKGF